MEQIRLHDGESIELTIGRPTHHSGARSYRAELELHGVTLDGTKPRSFWLDAGDLRMLAAAATVLANEIDRDIMRGSDT